MKHRVIVLLVLSFVTAPLAAVPLWSVESTDGGGEVLLLGSVHLLRAEDLPLPDAIHAAYERAARLVMELDPAELEPGASRAALERIGITSPGRSVRDILSDEERRHAKALAEDAGLDLRDVAGFEPWFAAIVLYTSGLAAAGYDPGLGVDQQVAAWAARDDKPMRGLETLDEQLLLFKRLDAATQRGFLLKTVEGMVAMEADTDALIELWRKGDLAALEDRLEIDFHDYDELRTRIVTDRNRAWLPVVEGLLDEPGTSLVVVGALHLVGPGGLPALLEAAGLQVTAVDTPTPD